MLCAGLRLKEKLFREQNDQERCRSVRVPVLGVQRRDSSERCSIGSPQDGPTPKTTPEGQLEGHNSGKKHDFYLFFY